jgi:hypothetical protein
MRRAIHLPSIDRNCEPCECAAGEGKPPHRRTLKQSPIRFERSKTIGDNNEIPQTDVPVNSCSGCIVNLDGPCQRLHQYDPQGRLGQRPPWPSLPPDESAPLALAGIVKTTYDGKGNFTQVDAVGINGNIVPGWRPGTGTYSVNPDCTGTATISIPTCTSSSSSGNRETHHTL